MEFIQQYAVGASVRPEANGYPKAEILGISLEVL